MNDNYKRLFIGLKKTLETEGNYFSELVRHNGEKGSLNETHLKKILANYLPKKYALATGFVVSNKTFQADNNGPQLDIIIYDALNNSPLYQSEAFGIFPIEMVYGYIEVKTTLTYTNLEEAFEANAKVRKLNDDKEYLRVSVGRKVPPRFYLFAYKSDIPETTLREVVENKYRNVGEAHCHGIYVLHDDVLIARKALYDPAKVEVMKWKNAFPIFLQRIIEHIESLKNRDLFALPLADMRKYLPPEEKCETD